MGSPLAPILSDLVMEDLFDHSIPKFPSSPIFLKKYVDDVICYIHKDHISTIHSIINQYNHNIQFTVEIEENSNLNFLDITLIRKNHKILTNWYNKPTSSGRLLNFHSCHPRTMKNNVAISFIKRVLTLSDITFRNQNIKLIKEILHINIFPNNVTNKWIQQESNTLSTASTTPPGIILTDQNSTNFSSMHYVPKLSESINNNIKSHNNDIKFAYKPTKTLNRTIFSKPKAKTLTNDKSGIVYKVDCLDCDKCYIGQTSKKLKKRLSQHQNDFKNRHSLDSKTSLITHTLETGHEFNFVTTSILDVASNKFKRELKEASHIFIHNQSTVNRKTDLNNLNVDYYNTLNMFATTSKLSPLKNKNKNKK